MLRAGIVRPRRGSVQIRAHRGDLGPARSRATSALLLDQGPLAMSLARDRLSRLGIDSVISQPSFNNSWLQVSAAVTAYVAHGHRLERFGFAADHRPHSSSVSLFA